MYEFVLPEHRRESRSTTPYRQMTELLRKENTVSIIVSYPRNKVVL